ncbi:MAG: PorT family protein [Bacteroidaceae bacterium]|nr:PorT family protein [Bacteroidaceae bacterium]MBR4129800.1 PorT family protein [Bacteroidaceae bacterium]
MRRLALLLLSVVCCQMSTVFAQVGEPRTDLAVGVNGGFVMNKVSFYPSVKQKFKMGLQTGVTARYTCEKYFNMLCALQGEINYSQAGWKENVKDASDTYQRTLHYVQVPLLANLGFGRERGGVKGFLVVGPQIGFCIGESTKDGERFNVPRELVGGKDQHDLEVQKKFEYGITGGLGMDVSTKNGHHFLVEGRYFYSLSDIYGNSKQDPFGRSANTTIIAKVSYLFDIKRTKL